MRKLTFLLPIFAAVALAACDDEQPPTQIVMQVTVPSTPIVLVVTPTNADGAVEVATQDAVATLTSTPELATSPAAVAVVVTTAPASATPRPANSGRAAPFAHRSAGYLPDERHCRSSHCRAGV